MLTVSISEDGSIIAIGAPRGNNEYTRMYKYNSDTMMWDPLGNDIFSENTFDQSGRSVSLSANGLRVAIGAPFRTTTNGSSSGYVRIYDYNGGTMMWNEIGNSHILGSSDNDFSGFSVSLSADGDRVAISSPGSDGGGSSRGDIKVYDLITGIWTLVGTAIQGENDNNASGTISLSADGTRVAIGVSNFNSQTGRTRVFEDLAGTWTQIGQNIDGDNTGDGFGSTVSLSGDGSKMAVGAVFANGETGYSRMYTYNTGTTMWDLLGSTIVGEALGDRSGGSVSLSADGNRVTIGADKNDSGGVDRGNQRIFDFENGEWVFKCNISGTADGDRLGNPLAMSADGLTVIVGSPIYPTIPTFMSQGLVRIYEIKIQNPVKMIIKYWNKVLNGLC